MSETPRNSTDLTRAQLLGMIGLLRGLVYSLKFELDDAQKAVPAGSLVDEEEIKMILDTTTFNVNEDYVGHRYHKPDKCPEYVEINLQEEML